MGHLSTMFNGLARTLSYKNGKNSWSCGGKDDILVVEKESKKIDSVMRGSSDLTSVYSKRGEKGVSQDCFIVWEEFGCQEDMIFCGIFDGHGPWGHYVAKRVRDTMPSSLLHNWQQTMAEASTDSELTSESDAEFNSLNIWKQSYVKACAAADQDLENHRKIDSFSSGTTALSIVKQGELMVVANVGDSRAVLATTSEDGRLVAVQLTVDFKPDLPQEAKRITECNGRIFCLEDEPGVHRVWRPHEDSPGLAMSRAFGDYSIKNFGLISVPEVTQTHITTKDQFVVLATDGYSRIHERSAKLGKLDQIFSLDPTPFNKFRKAEFRNLVMGFIKHFLDPTAFLKFRERHLEIPNVWDVISNEEAVEVVYSTTNRANSAKQLVKHAARAWRRKRKGIAMDDISAVCLFFTHLLYLHPNLFTL